MCRDSTKRHFLARVLPHPEQGPTRWRRGDCVSMFCFANPPLFSELWDAEREILPPGSTRLPNDYSEQTKCTTRTRPESAVESFDNCKLKKQKSMAVAPNLHVGREYQECE